MLIFFFPRCLNHGKQWRDWPEEWLSNPKTHQALKLIFQMYAYLALKGKLLHINK